MNTGGVYMNNVEEYYNYQYDEWGRLERHRIEYEITKKVLRLYIGDCKISGANPHP